MTSPQLRGTLSYIQTRSFVRCGILWLPNISVANHHRKKTTVPQRILLVGWFQLEQNLKQLAILQRLKTVLNALLLLQGFKLRRSYYE